MNVDQLRTVLVSRLQADEEDGEFEIPAGKEVTALLKTGADLLHVNKVQLVEVEGSKITLVTNDSEYFVEAGDIFSIKLESSRLQQRDSRPGFRRE